jgi:hippurate hydrolase
LTQELKDKGMNFSFCLPQIKAADAPNVVPEVCEISG